MKKKLITILLTIVIVLVLIIAGAVGFLWYRNSHVFIEGDAYPVKSAQIDLREKDVTMEYYLALQKALPNCEIIWNVPFQDQKVSSDSTRITVGPHITTVDSETLLNFFPNLKTIEAVHAGTRMNYQALENLAAERPEWEVLYQVDIGGTFVEPDVQKLDLQPEDYDYETMLWSMAYLHQLTEVKLHTPALTMEQIQALKETYPEISIACTAVIFGTEYDTQTTELDLSSMTDDDADTIAHQLAMLPDLKMVKLGELSMESVKTLMAAAPDVVFDYTFEFFGKTLSAADEEVVLANIKIGDENEEEIRTALDLLSNCKRFVLDNCRMSDEVMEKIREDYRGRTKVVWRVWFGNGSCLTDAEVIRCTYDLLDDNCADLYYCEDVRFVDFGHNEWLDGCDFIAGMKSLEYCILSGAPIKSLEPFANCKNLKFLEVAFCEYIESVEPLKNCTRLEKLNISNTHVVDLTPLDGLPLTNLVAMEINAGKSRVSVEEQERFVSQHPDCWSIFEGKQPYDAGWRREADQKTPLAHYATIQIAFRYPHSPNNAGWYLSEEDLAGMAALVPAEATAAAEEALSEAPIPEEATVEETVTE